MAFSLLAPLLCLLSRLAPGARRKLAQPQRWRHAGRVRRAWQGRLKHLSILLKRLRQRHGALPLFAIGFLRRFALPGLSRERPGGLIAHLTG